MIRLTIAVHEGTLPDAAHLAGCIGFGPADMDTFAIAPEAKDDDGELYRWASGLVSPAFLGAVAQLVQRPAWDVQPYAINLTAARRAQSLVVLWAGDGPVPQAVPEQITAVVGDDPLAALAAMGLTPVEAVL